MNPITCQYCSGRTHAGKAKVSCYCGRCKVWYMLENEKIIETNFYVSFNRRLMVHLKNQTTAARELRIIFQDSFTIQESWQEIVLVHHIPSNINPDTAPIHFNKLMELAVFA